MKELFFFGENKERVNNKPYVVSADIKILLEPWAAQRGFFLPNQEFFAQLRTNFVVAMTSIFPNFELISEEELSNGLSKMVSEAHVFPVSLDRVYNNFQPRLEITRTVDTENKSKGLSRRALGPTLISQFREIKSKGLSEIALVDDVIFTGDLLDRVCSVLEKIDVSVPYIYAGIGIDEGIKKLSTNGRKVCCVKTYTEVIDEICERDFYPGVPLSGRLVNDGENIGAPYILPFGKPTDWASIPSQSQVSFSQFCLQQTIELFTAIEGMSGTIVKCSDIERKIIGMPNDATRFVDILKSFI